MLVSVEHLLAKWEERLRGDVVVLQHDAFVGEGECPFLLQVFRGVAPLVLLLVVAVDLAFPVDVGHHLPTGEDAGHVALSAGAVLIEEKAGRAGFPDFCEYLREVFRAVEKQNQYRYVDVGRMFIHVQLVIGIVGYA